MCPECGYRDQLGCALSGRHLGHDKPIKFKTGEPVTLNFRPTKRKRK